jgi:hypothetical protein
MIVAPKQTSPQHAAELSLGRYGQHFVPTQLVDHVDVPKLPEKLDRAAVVLFAYYATDARPRREAEALTEAGFQVDVISLSHKSSDPARETINGVNVVLAPLRHRRGGKLSYVLEYGFFFIYAFLLLSKWSTTRAFQ